MKNLLLLLLTTILFASCGEMQEIIIINKNGSGTQEIVTDMVPMLRQSVKGMAHLMIEDIDQLDSAEIDAALDEVVWEELGEEVDSIISFQDRIDADVAADPDRMAILENTTMYMRGGRKYGYMHMGLLYKFDNIKDLERFVELSQQAGEKDQKFNTLMGDFDMKLKLSDNSFYRSYIRNSKRADMDDYDPQYLAKAFGNSSFSTTINTPGKIKSVDTKGYEIVERSERSITVKYNIADMLTAEEISIDLKWK